ncbi:MAG TPA: hypothetical protein PK772_07810 [Chitinophagaceae bacterium]|nr:hypothetical protein [Chitinophagaceae bacterium]
MEPANILYIESLSEEWCDKDVVMLHACFQLLKDCIEKEKLLNGHIDWNATKEEKAIKKEIEELYTWWINRDFTLEDKINEIQYHEDNEKLIRLIKIRGYLWT